MLMKESSRVGTSCRSSSEDTAEVAGAAAGVLLNWARVLLAGGADSVGSAAAGSGSDCSATRAPPRRKKRSCFWASGVAEWIATSQRRQTRARSSLQKIIAPAVWQMSQFGRVAWENGNRS